MTADLWPAPTGAPTTTAGREGLAALLAAPERAVIGLDFDGTLAPIVPDPEDARAHPGAVRGLALVAPRLGRLAIVTGRPAARAVEYSGIRGRAGLERMSVLGHYGRERWDAETDELTAPEPAPGVAVARAALPALLAELGVVGAYLEDKGSAVAVHTRRSPDPAAAMDRLREPLGALAGANALVVEPGRHVLELRPPGVDKGGALRTLAAEAAAPGPSAVVFVGDDLGDLAAYDAVDALRAEGVPGLLVCSGSDEVVELARRADVVVDGPAGVVQWLEGLALALG
ncbi:trehalose-phosphatase [Motilibacter aurantiacus]|uniref:trehalose-phosphatase n=1 Tax=Motilibacter aurantiacus TaxID=2714955 RepID=UPI00140C74A4|nr:trehalose-phosphatase [Motilibacter aurantiacus]NHC46783.1 trehalose-phosphatase [Motilibacter aurantiacus]